MCHCISAADVKTEDYDGRVSRRTRTLKRTLSKQSSTLQGSFPNANSNHSNIGHLVDPASQIHQRIIIYRMVTSLT